MLGQNGNVSRDAVLVEIGETGDVAWAEDEDGALLVYFSQTVRDAGETLHCRVAVFGGCGGRRRPALGETADRHARI